MDRDQIERKLDASQQAVEAALCALHERQVAEERAGFIVRMSFDRGDQEFCVGLVDQIKRGTGLTPAQLSIARKKMKRYWRQILLVMHTEPPKPIQRPLPPKTNGSSEPEFNDYGTW